MSDEQTNDLTPQVPQTQVPAPKPPATEVPKGKVVVKNPPIVWENTQKVLARLEELLSGKVVSYYVSPNWSMNQDDVKYFYSHLKKIGFQEKLYFIIFSSGGDGMSAWRLASLLRDFCNELVIILPEKAASAATMLSLAADELIMTPLSYLTAVDTSLSHPLNPKDSKGNPVRVELEEVKRSIDVLMKDNMDINYRSEIYKVIFSYIHPVALGSIERSKNLSEMICSDILELKKKTPVSPEVKTTIINQLNTAYPSHGYPIPRHKAKELGLNVTYSTKELDEALWDLINVYRFLTEPVRTDMSESFIHTEQVTKTIESVGSRLLVLNTFERKLDPIVKGWSTFKDEFKWISFFEKEEDGVKKLKTSYLEF